ncbi:hypothetical protein GBA52_024401 [Prunus armeniaca]|nr:hypothetical protein GBA52_024401 [Prunus armeniaca]
MLGLTSVDRVSASDPKSALALQRLVWFLGENANYAASDYAWESATPPGTALMMLDTDKMVAAASSRNPTLAGALTRLQRCAFSGSWEVRIIAAQALTTMAIRLLDLVSLFRYVPRAKYLHLGPISAKLIDMYHTRHNISASTGLSDPAVAIGISDHLIYESKPAAEASDMLDDDLVNAWAANLGDDGLLGNNAPAMRRVTS